MFNIISALKASLDDLMIKRANERVLPGENKETELLMNAEAASEEERKKEARENVENQIETIANRPASYEKRSMLELQKLAPRIHETGANINGHYTVRSSLMGAIQNRAWNLAREFLKMGANPNFRGQEDTPLMAVVRKNNLDMAKTLIEQYDAQVNDSRQGLTALHLAASNSNEEIMDYLIARGADALRKDFNGLTARDILKIQKDRQK